MLHSWYPLEQGVIWQDPLIPSAPWPVKSSES